MGPRLRSRPRRCSASPWLRALAMGVGLVVVISFAAAGEAKEDFPSLVGAHALVRKESADQLVGDPSAQGLMRLWLLAHDPDHDVVGAALKSALVRCRHEAFGICLASLQFFMDADANDGPESFRARVALLAEKPELARAYASRETKLDVVALLAGRLSEGGGPKAYMAALEQLAHDPEPDVQEAAGAILLQIDR